MCGNRGRFNKEQKSFKFFLTPPTFFFYVKPRFTTIKIMKPLIVGEVLWYYRKKRFLALVSWFIGGY